MRSKQFSLFKNPRKSVEKLAIKSEKKFISFKNRVFLLYFPSFPLFSFSDHPSASVCSSAGGDGGRVGRRSSLANNKGVAGAGAGGWRLLLLVIVIGGGAVRELLLMGKTENVYLQL
jgi:hypothetical protein